MPIEAHMLRPLQALSHPLWLGALALHIANDHWFKGAGLLPGALTGKLSDVAVLLTTPTVLAVLVRARSERVWRACHIAMGALFVALELSRDFTAVFRGFVGYFGFAWNTWTDWTDLLTLPTLILSWRVLGDAARRPVATDPDPRLPRLLRRCGELALVAAASLTCLATSQASCPDNVIDPNADGDRSPWSLDCDDEDPTRYPGAPEIPDDGIDQDCDGRDATAIEVSCWFRSGIRVNGEPTVLVLPDGPAYTPQASCAERDGQLLTGYIVVPELDAPLGRLSVTVESTGSGSFAVFASCADPSTELACVALGGPSIDVLVEPNSWVYVVVQGTPGDLTIRAAVEPILCGDGLLVAPEQCDDGNLKGGDGCDPRCQLEPSDGGGA